MSEEDRRRLMALRGMSVDAEPEPVQRRPMTEAEERLLAAAMQGAGSRRYYSREESELDKAQIAVLEERTPAESRERYRAAYLAQVLAIRARRAVDKEVPECIREKIREEVDEQFGDE